VGLVHFDTHTDTGTEVFGVELSHGTPMYKLVEAGLVDPQRYVQIGLRGYWPGKKEFSWQRERGIRSFFMHDVRERGIRAVVEEALAGLGPGPVFLTVDIDVLDPAFAPGTGTPEPGGMTTGLPGDRLAHRAGRRGCRRSDPYGGRLRGHYGTRGRPDRPRDPHRSRALPEGR
jgi:arginase family enzyme